MCNNTVVACSKAGKLGWKCLMESVTNQPMAKNMDTDHAFNGMEGFPQNAI